MVGRISQAFSTRLFMKMDSRVLLCRLIFVTSREEVVLPKNDPEVVKNAFSWGLQKMRDSMHLIYLLFCFGQIIRNLDRIRYLVKRRCDFSEYSISSPTKRIFLPKLDPPKEALIFPMQNHEYH